MPTPHRQSPLPARRSRARSGALALASLLVLSGCAAPKVQADATPAGLATGIPSAWAAGIDDGLERYPDLGSMGMGDLRWVCPLVETVPLDGEDLPERGTTFWKLDEGVHELECGFSEDGDSATLRYAQAGDATAFAGLVDSTDAFEQPGNRQVQDATSIGERDYVLVTWTFPTNESAGARYVACYLDEASLARACLELNEPEKDSAEHSGQQAAEILSGILAA